MNLFCQTYMRFTHSFFFSVLTSIVLNGQNPEISGVIVDAADKQKLPFANIMVIGETIGTTSDKDGYFTLNIDDSLRYDSLIVSYVGYESCILPINKINFTIQLKPLSVEIGELVVKPASKKKKPIIINKFKRKDCGVRYSPTMVNTNLWVPTRPKEPAIEALYFPYRENYINHRKIKEIRMAVTNYKQAPSYFNVRLFEVNEDNIPGNDLIDEPLIIEAKADEQFIKIDLEKYNLIMPENGLFIGFELLIIDANKSKPIYEKGTEINFFNPFLNFFRNPEKQFFWLYSKGKWIETYQETPHFTRKNVMVYYKPAISLVLEN